MISMTLQQAADAMNGTLSGASTNFESVATDTRHLQGGELFFALRGPNFDAHDYLDKADAAGVAAAVVDKDGEDVGVRIRVSDTRMALGDLARFWRGMFHGPVVGITGSNGKTSVKEMTAAIFAGVGRVHATKGNFNNDIGVPLTLFDLRANQEYAVIEMGANHPGEIAYLVGLAKPDAAVITNAGPAHLEGFGDLDGVAWAKGEMFAGMSKSGVAVINKDDPRCGVWEQLAAGRTTLTFAIDSAADIRAQWWPENGGSRVKLSTSMGDAEFFLPVPGKHNISNALAATGLALAVGVSLEHIVEGLSSFKPVKGRMLPRRCESGAVIFDDTYNANPGSLSAGLDVLVSEPGRHWLVLGDMGEMGADASAIHADCGLLAREKGVQRLVTLGPLSAEAGKTFGAGAVEFDDVDGLVDALRDELDADARVLVKGSRAMRMERVVAGLLNETGAHSFGADGGDA